jgi:hypothetical protein
MNAKPTDHDDPRPTRSSGWVVFFLFGALLGVHAIYLMVLPSVEPDHWREFTTDPKMLAYLADDFRSAGAMQLGSAVMSMAVAGRWFRLAGGLRALFGTSRPFAPGRCSPPPPTRP